VTSNSIARVTGYSYDAAGSLTNIAYPAGVPPIRATYDKLRRITSMTDALGTTAFTYSALGFMDSEISGNDYFSVAVEALRPATSTDAMVNCSCARKLGSWGFLMSNRCIRDKNIRRTQRLGITIPDALPLLDEGLQMRETSDVVCRLLALDAVVSAACGFPKEKAAEWLNQEGLLDWLTAEERSFILDDLGEAQIFQVEVEAAWALAWAVQIADKMDFAKECPSYFVTLVPDLKRMETSTHLRKRARARCVQEVVSACDLAYCLHWALTESELHGSGSGGEALIPYVIVERRHALEWLLSNESWEDVPMDT
jgi:YD repeat-containing protein